MLTDPEEIAIMARARQSALRNPARSRRSIQRIFAEFLAGVELKGKRLLDLGPGQFDFGELARERGAEVWGVDTDPAVVALGKKKRFTIFFENIAEFPFRHPDFRFDGLFCKYSIDAFWFKGGASELIAHTNALANLLNEGGWAWIAPWNGDPASLQDEPAEIERRLAVQQEAFAAQGFEFVELSEAESRTYGVHGITANRCIFLKNLPNPLRP